MTDDYIIPAATLVKLGKGDAKAGRRVLRAIIAMETRTTTRSAPAEKPTDVRLATEEDTETLVSLLRDMILENSSNIAPYNETVVRKTVSDMLSAPCASVVLLEKNGVAIGTMGLELERLLWSDQWFLAERWLYIAETHRSLPAVASLVDYARYTTDKMTESVGHRVYFTLGIQGTRDMAAKMMMFRRFLAFAGANFIYPDATITR